MDMEIGNNTKAPQFRLDDCLGDQTGSTGCNSAIRPRATGITC